MKDKLKRIPKDDIIYNLTKYQKDKMMMLFNQYTYELEHAAKPRCQKDLEYLQSIWRYQKHLMEQIKEYGW